MADFPAWEDGQPPFVFLQPTSSSDILNFEQSEFNNNILNWRSGTTNSLPNYYGVIPSPSVQYPTQLTDDVSSTESRILLHQSQDQHGHDNASIPALPHFNHMVAELSQYPTQSPRPANAPRVTELACPDCPERRFGRKAEKERHDNEQHLCSHPACKGEWFSVEQRELHIGFHGSMIEYNCGTCDLSKLPKSTFKRCDRLSRHFEAVHGVRKMPSRIQCRHLSCYETGLCGGLFFVSHDDLARHCQLEHSIGGPDTSAMDDGTSPLELTTSKQTGTIASGKPAPSRRHDCRGMVFSCEFTRRDVDAMPAMQSQDGGATSSHSTAKGYNYEGGGHGITHIVDSERNVVGVLFRWDQIDKVSIKMIGRKASSQKQTYSVGQLSANMFKGARTPTATQSNLERSWERPQGDKQDTSTMATAFEHAQSWNERETMMDATPNFETQHIHSGQQSDNHGSPLHEPNPSRHDTPQAMNHASHTRRTSDKFQGQAGVYPSWGSSCTAFDFSDYE